VFVEGKKTLFFLVATNQSVPSFEGLGSAIMKENNHIFFLNMCVVYLQ
jgi:hypothetical protein